MHFVHPPPLFHSNPLSFVSPPGRPLPLLPVLSEMCDEWSNFKFNQQIAKVFSFSNALERMTRAKERGIKDGD